MTLANQTERITYLKERGCPETKFHCALCSQSAIEADIDSLFILYENREPWGDRPYICDECTMMRECDECDGQCDGQCDWWKSGLYCITTHVDVTKQVNSIQVHNIHSYLEIRGNEKGYFIRLFDEEMKDTIKVTMPSSEGFVRFDVGSERDQVASERRGGPPRTSTCLDTDMKLLYPDMEEMSDDESDGEEYESGEDEPVEEEEEGEEEEEEEEEEGEEEEEEEEEEECGNESEEEDHIECPLTDRCVNSRCQYCKDYEDNNRSGGVWRCSLPYPNDCSNRITAVCNTAAGRNHPRCLTDGIRDHHPYTDSPVVAMNTAIVMKSFECIHLLWIHGVPMSVSQAEIFIACGISVSWICEFQNEIRQLLKSTENGNHDNTSPKKEEIEYRLFEEEEDGDLRIDWSYRCQGRNCHYCITYTEAIVSKHVCPFGGSPNGCDKDTRAAGRGHTLCLHKIMVYTSPPKLTLHEAMQSAVMTGSIECIHLLWIHGVPMSVDQARTVIAWDVSADWAVEFQNEIRQGLKSMENELLKEECECPSD
jgi:hypothetical protein